MARVSRQAKTTVKEMKAMLKMKEIAAIAVCIVALPACSLISGRSGNRFAVRGSSTRVPTVNELSAKYGCSATQIADNWRRARLSLARPGTPICDVLGRYGEPVSVRTSSSAGMQLVSMLHRQPNGRYYNATFVYYGDTRANRQLQRPIGRWVVERVSASR